MRTVNYVSTQCPECGSGYCAVRNSRQTRVIKVRYHVCVECGARFRSVQDKSPFFERGKSKAVV